jgi:hypothetical protein
MKKKKVSLWKAYKFSKKEFKRLNNPDHIKVEAYMWKGFTKNVPRKVKKTFLKDRYSQYLEWVVSNATMAGVKPAEFAKKMAADL